MTLWMSEISPGSYPMSCWRTTLRSPTPSGVMSLNGRV